MTQALTMQPPTADELELKQHVTKALASQGVLGKIKAQLRAAVFHVMHEHEQDDELLATNNKLQEFKHDSALALAVVMDFLAFFQLEHSLAVLRAEANAENNAEVEPESQLQMDKLCERLGLSQQHTKGDSGTKQQPEQQRRAPLLIQILQQPHVGPERLDDRWASHGRREIEADTKEQQFSSSDSYTQRRMKAGECGGNDLALDGKLSTERLPTIAPPTAATVNSRIKYAVERAGESESDDGDEDDKNAIARGIIKQEKLDASTAVKQEKKENDDEEDDDIASGSELSESITEEQSASLNYSQDYESASKDENVKRGVAAVGGFEVNTRAAAIREEEEEEDGHRDSGDEKDDDDRKEMEKDEESAELTAPPPVPTTLSSSSLPPIAASTGSSNLISSRRGTLQDDDEFDEELEAARLSSLDAKLKAMEAEDETGTLQQLKASLQMELQQEDDALKKKSSGTAGRSTDGGDAEEEEEHDGYGSDFEEEEVISEVSDDEVGSVSDLLSDNDESQSQVLSTLQQQDPRPQSAKVAQTLHDKPVEDENALNSYDYIEAVERDW